MDSGTKDEPRLPRYQPIEKKPHQKAKRLSGGVHLYIKLGI